MLVVLSWRLNLTGRGQPKALSYIWFKTRVIITFPSTKNKGKAGFEHLGVKQRSIKCSGAGDSESSVFTPSIWPSGKLRQELGF